jgi:hypothetical protein
MFDTENPPSQNGKTLGSKATITFASMGKNPIEGKVDTGATTSSLHAENINVNQQRGTVTFVCPELSSNSVTMELDGAQEVSSADGGEQVRPMVRFDVEIDGVLVRNAVFNLNDRGSMDSSVLIGQNILKAGGFVVDVNKNGGDAEGVPPTNEAIEVEDRPEGIDGDTQLLEAVRIILDSRITTVELFDLMKRATQTPAQDIE